MTVAPLYPPLRVLLAGLAARGVRLLPEGASLRVLPAGGLTEGDRLDLLAFKSELVAWLAAADAALAEARKVADSPPAKRLCADLPGWADVLRIDLEHGQWMRDRGNEAVFQVPERLRSLLARWAGTDR